jgi:uncharacterized membrane protein YfcA
VLLLAAGFIDAIEEADSFKLPGILLPNLPVSTVIGTLKNTCFQRNFICGLPVPEKVTMDWKLLLIMVLVALPSAFLVSTLLTYMSNDFMKPFYILSLLAIYTYAKKILGSI